MADNNSQAPLLSVSSREQYRTAQDLIERSRPSEAYYVLLAISSIIVSAGLLLNNTAIVVGGMLVTPVLTPLLAIALGLAIGEVNLMRDTGNLLLKSVFIIIIFSSVMALVMGSGENSIIPIENTIRSALLYFVVALASGIAAAFAWARKELSEALPGVAIAVSLVPPLSLVGIWASMLHLEVARFYFSLFLLNLFGIVIGSLAVFLLLKFYKSEEKIRKAVEVSNKETR